MLEALLIIYTSAVFVLGWLTGYAIGYTSSKCCNPNSNKDLIKKGK